MSLIREGVAAASAVTFARVAEEVQEQAGGLLHTLLPWAELIITGLLVVATFALFVVTDKVHKDEVTKMGDHMAEANNNMTDVALAEIDSHSTARARMRAVRNLHHTLMRRRRTRLPR